MSKSALNMLTRTSGLQLAARMIYMTAVDTGWVTDERPLPEQAKLPFSPPLDELDGAMRVLHPVLSGFDNGPLYCGIFLKDYKRTVW